MTAAKWSILAILVVFFLVVVSFGVLPHEASRIFLNQYRAVRSMSQVNLAERNYAIRHPEAGYACSLTDLGKDGLVDSVLASQTKNSYRFEIQCLKDGVQRVSSYAVTAVPESQGVTGNYSLCTNQNGEIWYSENGIAADCLAARRPIERKYRDAAQQ
jgi:hypothetical protein